MIALLVGFLAVVVLICIGVYIEGFDGGDGPTPGPSSSTSLRPRSTLRPDPSFHTTPRSHTTSAGPTSFTTTSSTTSTNTTSTTSTSASPRWNSNPIEVKGSHMYDAVTGESFFARGIAFPNLAEDATIDDYIDTIRRLKSQSSNFNMIRMYQYPSCIWETEEGWCMAPFFEEADKLGIYVLVAATGTFTGYLPQEGFADAQECYEQGDVLTLGKQIIQKFNYPNTLGIVIGHEFIAPTTFSVISVLKAYARDLKAYMDMCNSDEDSPSYGAFRKIPLLYASGDAGDALNSEKAAYLFCGSAEVSIDIFGLNIERWCDPETNSSYDSVQNWVSEANLPGAFIFSEMGCPQNVYPGGVRQWEQIRDFFATYSAIDGFAGSSYFSNGSFKMFSEASPYAAELPDGQNFFKALNAVGAMENRKPGSPSYAKCQLQFPNFTIGDLDEGDFGDQDRWYDPQIIEPYSRIMDYNQANFTAKSCPSPRVPPGALWASKAIVV